MIEEVIKRCPFYQRHKTIHKHYGHLPPKNIKEINPWDEVHVYMIGPWKVVINNFEHQIRAVPYIDAVISLPEVIPVEDAKSKTVANAFEDHWLSRYPIPRRCIHDNGNEILGPDFRHMLSRNGIQSVPTTVKNPQANSMVERLHQIFKVNLSISLQENLPTSYEEVFNLIQCKCAAAQFAIRTAVHSQHKASPGELAFGRHMLYPFSRQVDWNQLLEKKQSLIDQANIKEISKRKYYDYKEQDLILILILILILNKATAKGKLEPVTLPEGPWKITQVHTNGTVSILRNNYIVRINIRRIRPFFN